MYRIAATRDPDAAPAPAELVYMPRVRLREPVVVVLFKLFSVPGVLGLVIASLISPGAGLGAMLITAAVMLWARHRATRAERVVLRVEDGALRVLPARSAGREATAPLPLRDLLDVSMDTCTVRPVLDADDGVPALRFTAGRVAPDTDTARIVLEGRAGPIPLTDAYLPKLDTVEEFGRLRVFLRQHGWVPEDERET